MIHCRIVTPQGTVREMDTAILNVVGAGGQLGLLPGHMPLVTPLAISRMTTQEAQGRKEYAVAGGLMYFERNQATILTEAMEERDQIDLERAEKARDRALTRLQDPNMDFKRAQAALKRALNRIAVKTGQG